MKTGGQLTIVDGSHYLDGKWISAQQAAEIVEARKAVKRESTRDELDGMAREELITEVLKARVERDRCRRQRNNLHTQMRSLKSQVDAYVSEVDTDE